MKRNVGNIDKMVRILAAIVIAVLYFTNVISGTLAIILLSIAGIFLVTSFLGFCPIYWAIGLSSKPKQEEIK